MESPSVNFKRSETQSLVSLLGTASELHGGNVLLILDNDVQLSTHICFLSSSPILKRLFLDLEVRIDKTSCISMPGFDEATVRQLLQFLHRGFVVFESKRSQSEFLKLCTCLKINPSVVKDFNVEETEPDSIRESTAATSDVPNEVFENTSEKSDNNEETCDTHLEKDGVPDTDSENNVVDDLNATESERVEESSDEETPEHISDFLNQMIGLQPEIQPPVPGTSVPDNIQSEGADGGSDVEDSCMEAANNEICEQPSFSSENADDMSGEDTFKMPDSFDLPTDYIEEILPNKTVSMSVKNTASPIKNLSQDSSLSSPDKPGESRSSENSKSDAPGEKAKSTSGNKSLNLKDTAQADIVGDGNSPMEEEDVVQITYKKDASSKRNQGIQGKINPRRDRKKMMAALFNDSDSSSENEESREQSRTPTPTNITNELEAKKNRMKSKLEWERPTHSQPKKSAREKAKKILKSSGPHSKVQRNQRALGDDKFIVSDNEVDEILSNKSESERDSEEDEENSSSGSDSEDERRKRLDDRKKKKGGDVLAWMSRRPPVKVIVQTSPRAYIQDMAQYRLRLLAEGQSGESEPEAGPSVSSASTEHSQKPTDSKVDSNSGSSDDSIPRGKRISALKSSSDSESEDRNRKKIKKHKKHKRSKSRLEIPEPSFPVEEVIWTPSMYQKWDKLKPKKRSGDSGESDSSRGKQKQIKRSHSIDLKKSPNNFKHKFGDKSKFQRSISSIDNPGHESSSPATPSKLKSNLHWPAAGSLPKIPKLKKPE